MIAWLLSILPPLLKLIEQFVLWANTKKLVDQGRREAIADAAQSRSEEHTSELQSH